MLVFAIIVTLEKTWLHGLFVARTTDFALIALAALVLVHHPSPASCKDRSCRASSIRGGSALARSADRSYWTTSQYLRGRLPASHSSATAAHPIEISSPHGSGSWIVIRAGGSGGKNSV